MSEAQPATYAVTGQEILIVDGDETVQRGLEKLLEREGLVATAVGEAKRARLLTREKFFSAALVDLDTPSAGAGLTLIGELRELSPSTVFFVLAPRKSFDAAVGAFRAGASDIIVKQPDQIDHLRTRVLQACRELKGHEEEARLLGEAMVLQEDLFRRMVELSSHAADLEERMGGGAHSRDADGLCTLLLVEPSDPAQCWLGPKLAELSGQRPGLKVTIAATGGEGLDRASAERYHIVLVADALPDLPATMVTRTIRTQSPDSVVISFSRPGKGGLGHAERVEQSGLVPLAEELRDAAALLSRIDELERLHRERVRERRHLAAFRQENYPLVQRYATLRQKMANRLRST